jgi:glycosyltransferase involved in cell wall biosynthesis
LIKNKSILVTGIARNVAKIIPREVIRIEKEMNNIFEKVNFLVIESDSIDNTTKVLEKMKSKKNNFNYKSLGKIESTFPNRIQRLAFCRNTYVKEIRENTLYKDVDFVAIVDFDIKNNRLKLNQLKKLIGESNWSAIFANQTGLYYDIYALRKKGWVENDCFAEYRKNSICMSTQDAKELAIWSKMKKIKKGSPLIPVNSAFGGLGIYRKNVFMNFDYSLLPKKLHESEHVSLHKKITDSKGLLFIAPNMTNFSWGTNNLSRFKLFRMLDQVSNRKGFKTIRGFARKLLS